jgi:hypothetical protein
MALPDITHNNLNLDCRTTYGLCWEDIHEIESHDRMPIGCIHSITDKWDYFITNPRVINVIFKNGRPFGFQYTRFTNIDLNTKEQFIEFLAKISLTHRLMFVESDGGIFVTESEDGQTNIDAELIETLAEAAYRRYE